MGKEQFIGSWELISSEFRRSDGEVSYPWGRDTVGILMYDADGNMSGQIMRPDRTEFVLKDHMKGTPSEIKSAFEGYIAYYGTYEIKEDEKTVIHHVEGSLMPNMVGRAMRRFYEFSDNRLVLTTPAIQVGGQQVVGVLIWERL